jgi:hypothetical protein
MVQNHPSKQLCPLREELHLQLLLCQLPRASPLMNWQEVVFNLKVVGIHALLHL